MGPLHRWTPPGQPLPERTPLAERAEGKQEVDEKQPQHSWEADLTDCFPTGPPGSEESTVRLRQQRTVFQSPHDLSVQVAFT